MTDDGAKERLRLSVELLAASRRSIKERLSNAWISGLGPLRPEDFTDPSNRELFETIRATVTKLSGAGHEGHLMGSVRAMDETAAEQVAREIVSLFYRVMREDKT